MEIKLLNNIVICYNCYEDDNMEIKDIENKLNEFNKKIEEFRRLL